MFFQLILLLAICLFGASGLLYLRPKLRLVELLGLSFPVGSFLVTFGWFLLNWKLNVPINLILGFCTMLVGVISFAVSVFLNRKHLPISSYKLPMFSVIQVVMLSVIGVFFLESLITNIIMPIHDWDALTLYDFRAKVVAESQSVIANPITEAYFLGYPMYTTLGHVTAYIFDSDAAKIWYSLVYSSVLIMFYSVLRRSLNTSVSLFGTVALAAHPAIFGHAHMSYTNLPFIMFYSFAVLYFFLWIRSNVYRDLIVFSILLAASMWVRFAEPFHLVMLVSLLLAIVVFRRKLWLLLSLIPVFAVRQIWQGFTSSVKIIAESSQSVVTSNISRSSLLLNSSHWESIVSYFNAAVVNHYIFLLILLMLSFILFLKRKQKLPLFYLVIVGGHIAFLFVGTVYFSVMFDKWAEIPGSLTRISYVLIPLIYYVLLMSISKDVSKETEE